MPKVVAQISDDVYKKLEEEVKLGIFQNASEAISAAIKKTYSKKSRAYLKWVMRKEGITEASMLEELKAIRR
jgi:Arc/MetJ-type ribon-helix-helix transcriptional regulator